MRSRGVIAVLVGWGACFRGSSPVTAGIGDGSGSGVALVQPAAPSRKRVA
jgi:hypothetical protein